MPCNHDCRQGRDCNCRPAVPGPDPLVFHVLNTTADAGARFRLTDGAVVLAREAEAHLCTLATLARQAVAARRIRRQREAIGA